METSSLLKPLVPPTPRLPGPTILPPSPESLSNPRPTRLTGSGPRRCYGRYWGTGLRPGVGVTRQETRGPGRTPGSPRRGAPVGVAGAPGAPEGVVWGGRTGEGVHGAPTGLPTSTRPLPDPPSTGGETRPGCPKCTARSADSGRTPRVWTHTTCAVP